MATNGPYSWGNGPQPRRGRPKPMGGDHKKKGCCYAGQALKVVWLGKFKLAARLIQLDYKARKGLI